MEDLVDILKLSELTLKLPPKLWQSFDKNLLKILKDSNWSTFKYITDSGNLNDKINEVSNESGGIYVFYVSPEIVPERQRILMYVGEAQRTEGQNLRKRIREYYSYYKKPLSGNMRPKIYAMFHYWAEYLYCSYIEIEDNAKIIEIETEIINNLVLPMNDRIPNKETSRAIRAAGL